MGNNGTHRPELSVRQYITEHGVRFELAPDATPQQLPKPFEFAPASSKPTTLETLLKLEPGAVAAVVTYYVPREGDVTTRVRRTDGVTEETRKLWITKSSSKKKRS